MKHLFKVFATILLTITIITQGALGEVSVFASTTRITVDNSAEALTAYMGSGNYNDADKADIKSNKASAYSSSFSGYIKKNGSTYTNVTSPFTIQHGNTSPTYLPDVEYTITINTDGGTGGTATGTKYRPTTNTFSLQNPTKSSKLMKYTFAGWTGSNGTTAQTSVSIPKGSQGNKSYTANWSNNEIDLYSNSCVKVTSTTNIAGSGSMVGFQGDGTGKFYAMRGNFTNNNDPNIKTNGTLIYDAGSSDAGSANDNFIHAERLANLMNAILYRYKGSTYGTNTLWFNDESTSSSTKTISAIDKGFYSARGNDSYFRCNAQGYAGFYSYSYVGSYYVYAVWW